MSCRIVADSTSLTVLCHSLCLCSSTGDRAKNYIDLFNISRPSISSPQVPKPSEQSMNTPSTFLIPSRLISSHLISSRLAPEPKTTPHSVYLTITRPGGLFQLHPKASPLESTPELYSFLSRRHQTRDTPHTSSPLASKQSQANRLSTPRIKMRRKG